MRLRAFLVYVCVIGMAASAADPPGDPNALRTIDDYLREAALNNAGLRAKFDQWRAAVEQVPQARALPDPRFTYGYFIEKVETRVGPQRQRFSLMQTFPWFGTIEARTDAAAATAKAAHKDYESSKLELFYKVKNAFDEYAYLGRAVSIAEQNLELLKHFEQVARTKYIAAVATHPDVIQAQIELVTLEDKVISLQRLREPTVAALNAALNRKAASDLPWPARRDLSAERLDRKALATDMMAGNPQLAGMDYEVEAARAQVELARKRSYPDIGLGVDWIETGPARMNTSDSGKDPIVAMLSVNLPIWTDSYKAAERQAQARARSVSSARSQRANELVAQFEQALYAFEDSRRKVDLYHNVLIPKAHEMLEASESAYRVGQLDFLSLVNAQRTLLGFELAYERAATDSNQRLAELEMLVGKELTGGSGLVSADESENPDN